MPDSGWRYVWADNAKYDGEKELLSLFSAPKKKDVILKNSIGDELYAESGVLSTKEDDDTYSFKNSRGKSPVQDDDIPASDKDKTKKGGGTEKGPGKSGGGISGPIGHKA